MEQLLYIPGFCGVLEEYRDAADLEESYQRLGCGGLEIIRCGEDTRRWIKPEMIRGVHMIFYPVWLDFWRGNEKGLAAEFGGREVWEDFYGGSDPSVLLDQFAADLDYAQEVGARYVVFHVSDVTIEGVFTHKHLHTDEEVIDGAVEIINRLLDGRDYSFDFLMENLWWPGLVMTRPEMTKRLLDGVHYEKKGLMLDLGHLMCSNMDLESEEAAVEYVHHMLDLHQAVAAAEGGEGGGRPLTQYIKGVHMHQSVSGAFAKAALEETENKGLSLAEDYYGRFSQVYELLGKIDTHRPFSCPQAKDLIRRIAPDYLVHELMAENRPQREAALRQQAGLLK